MKLRILIAIAATFALADAANAAETCEIHVWQTRLFETTTGAPAYDNTIIGALLQGDPNKKYPVGSAKDQMELELNGDFIEQMITDLPWNEYTSGRPASIVMESQIADKDMLKRLKKDTARNTASTAACYLEIYVDEQIFQGGMIKSWLFSTLKVRAFDGPKPKLVNAINYAHAPNFPAKDEASIPAARESIHAAFAKNLDTFFRKKVIKKRS